MQPKWAFCQILGQIGLGLENMKNVVNYHDTREQQIKGKHGGMVYLFRKKVDGKTLAVVAEVKKKEAWLITGWFET